MFRSLYRAISRKILGTKIKGTRRLPIRTLSSEAESGRLIEAKVKRITDGDGVIVSASGSEIEIRLDGIDCPEYDQPWGDNAKTGLVKQIGGRHVYLETHGKDIYDRTLATIYVMDGTELVNVNERMVQCGHAWVAHMYCQHLSRSRQRQLNVLERFARLNRVGLWKTENPLPPWLWRNRDSA